LRSLSVSLKLLTDWLPLPLPLTCRTMHPRHTA
jgi:hypothetical protein